MPLLASYLFLSKNPDLYIWGISYNSKYISELNKKEVVEAVTLIETPPVVIVGVSGYIETPQGMRTLKTVHAEHPGEEFKRRLYKNW